MDSPNPTMNPAIVVSAFDRPKPLKRILHSVQRSSCPRDVPLVISLDYSDCGEVREIAEAFEWDRGEKRLIFYEKHLGLREHTLRCGDLSRDYGSVVILEDDLYVSPFFYHFAKQALEFYETRKYVAGIGLFARFFNETAYLPMIPIPDLGDVYFSKVPCSWGHAWSAGHWNEFRAWVDRVGNSPIDEGITIPGNVLQWPQTSLKKYTFKYLHETGRYFVYPRVSMTSNFVDPGLHNKGHHKHLQAPLEQVKEEFSFIEKDECLTVYDAYCELEPESFKGRAPQLEGFDFEVDLYGCKEIEKITKNYLLTSRPCRNPEKSFGLHLKPHEMNVIQEVEGDDLHMVKREFCGNDKPEMTKARLSYYSGMPMRFMGKTEVEENIRPKPKIASDTIEKIEQLQKQLERLEKSRDQYKNKFEKIYFSRGWKILSILRKAKNKVFYI